MMKNSYDVIVVGAGFAGATIANLLARENKNTIDKFLIFDYIENNRKYKNCIK